jgi:hypothetical protein
MARKRFSQIDYLIKKGKQMGINSDADDNIAAYRAYRSGTSDAYKVTPTNRQSLQPASLVPFCALNFTTRYMTRMSGRAFAAMGQNSVTQEKLNIDAATNTTEETGLGGQKQKGFQAAKMTLFVGAGTSTTVKSGILLTNYKRRTGTSFTYPFGKEDKPNEVTYPHMTGNLYKDFARGNRSVSFKPEKAA